MKIFFLSLAILSFATTTQAKIWRVNNNPGVAADFTTVQAAHNSASAGDTIHLEPSIYTYGSLTMSKKLYIVSTGQFVSDNPGFQQDSRMGYVGNVTINNAGANGSVLSIRFGGSSGEITISGTTVNNISLINCASIYDGQCNPFGGNLNINNSYNITVIGCWFSAIFLSGTTNNIVISNNIIGARVTTDNTVSGIVIKNNVINAVTNCTYSYSIYNAQVTNNIFNKGLGANFVYTTSSVFKNNFSSDNNLPSGNGNVNNVTMSNVFVNATGNFVDNQYLLKIGSPAIGAGLSGEDLGAFGGPNPYRLAATPAIPSIYKLVVPTTPVSNTMNITFSTRSN